MEEKYFEYCIKLAEKASKKNEVPVGAIIIYKNKIISKAFNLREKKKDITAHAEILAIKKAAKKLKTWNLKECILFVTLKPCSMCESIINQSKIKNVLYLCDKLDYKKEYFKTTYQQYDIDILQQKYKKILSAFFQNKR